MPDPRPLNDSPHGLPSEVASLPYIRYARKTPVTRSAPSFANRLAVVVWRRRDSRGTSNGPGRLPRSPTRRRVTAVPPGAAALRGSDLEADHRRRGVRVVRPALGAHHEARVAASFPSRSASDNSPRSRPAIRSPSTHHKIKCYDRLRPRLGSHSRAGAMSGSTRSREWSSAGYFVCSHAGCSKRIYPRLTEHDCCGKAKHDSTHAYWKRDGMQARASQDEM